MGDGLDARGGAAAEGESGGPGFDPYADPFAPSDSESPAGEERSGLSEREPSRAAIETTTWTLSPEDSESNDLAPEEPRGTRLPQSSAPGYLVD